MAMLKMLVGKNGDGKETKRKADRDRYHDDPEVLREQSRNNRDTRTPEEQKQKKRLFYLEKKKQERIKRELAEGEKVRPAWKQESPRITRDVVEAATVKFMANGGLIEQVPSNFQESIFGTVEIMGD